MGRQARSKALKRHIFVLLLILALLLPFFPVSAADLSETAGPEASVPAVYTLPVFETSDIHGYLADTSSSRYEYRLAYISDKVRDARSTTGSYRKDRGVLLDGGDIFQGNTMSNVLKGSSLSAAFIRMDYDAVALGNHEFDWGVHTVIDDDGTMLDSMLDETPEVNLIPVVSTNLYFDRQKITFAHEYVILEKTAADKQGNELPVRIGVVGFTEDHAGSIMETKFTGAGFITIVDYHYAEQLARELEESGQCDATILLTHGAAEDAAYSLGEGSAFDLVLGGHTHASVTGQTSWGLAYMQPAAYSTAFAEAELVFSSSDGKPVFTGIQDARTVGVTDAPSKLYPTEANASELDPVIVELTDRVVYEISDLLEAYVGYLSTSVKKSDYIAGSGNRASVGGNFMASIIARAVGAEVGFVNNGGIRTDLIITSGWSRPVTVSDVYTMFPFNNLLYCYELTYEEFLDLLQYALTESGGSLLSRMTGIECWYVGETVQAIVRDGKAVYLNGEWAPGWADRKIRIGVSEFIATSNRLAGSMSNPLIAWSKTSRLISSDIVDAEGAFRVLDEESLANNWELKVDKKAYFISGRFTGEMWQEGDPLPPEAEETKESVSEELPIDDPASAPDVTQPERMTPDMVQRQLAIQNLLLSLGIALAAAVVITLIIWFRKRMQ